MLVLSSRSLGLGLQPLERCCPQSGWVFSHQLTSSRNFRQVGDYSQPSQKVNGAPGKQSMLINSHRLRCLNSSVILPREQSHSTTLHLGAMVVSLEEELSAFLYVQLRLQLLPAIRNQFKGSQTHKRHQNQRRKSKHLSIKMNIVLMVCVNLAGKVPVQCWYRLLWAVRGGWEWKMGKCSGVGLGGAG